jgi:hypothetical protein
MIKKMRLLGPGLYSVASGYECQFLGAISHFPVTQIWQAKSEAKCKFFARLFMHNRVLTADNMSKSNWTCDPLCSFCVCNPETSKHLFSQCNYTKAVWDLITPRFSLHTFSSLMNLEGMSSWIPFLIISGSKNHKKKETGYPFTF